MTPREELLRLGANGGLIGVASLPERDENSQPRVGVLFLNAGLVPRSGPSRLWVNLARAAARSGRPALRLDFSGIGDSTPAANDSRFEQRSPREAQLALDGLAAAAGCERFVVAGLCSGAEIAFKTALVDRRVVEIVLINAPRFLEEPSAELVQRLERSQAARYYWRVALRNPSSWWKALRGHADLKGILRAIATRLWPRSRSAGAPLRSADARAFDELAERGVKVRLVISEGDWAQDYLEAILGVDFRGSAVHGNLELLVLPAADHLVTPLDAQERLRAAFAGWCAEWR